MPSLPASAGRDHLQSAPLQLEAVAALPLTVDALVPNGPVGGQNFIVLSSMFLLREMELSTARIEH
eukprot:4761634-Amphidinium_carterae.5